MSGNRSVSQIDYEIDKLLKKKEQLKKVEVEEKVNEFIKVFNEVPPSNNNDLKRILNMFATDIKVIWERQ